MKKAPQVTLDKATIIRKFFRHSYIRLRNVTRAVAESAQDLVWYKSVKPKDAIHVATALEANVPVLETFDKELLGLSGKIGTSGLIIRKPIPPDQGVIGPAFI